MQITARDGIEITDRQINADPAFQRMLQQIEPRRADLASSVGQKRGRRIKHAEARTDLALRFEKTLFENGVGFFGGQQHTQKGHQRGYPLLLRGARVKDWTCLGLFAKHLAVLVILGVL